MTYELRPLSVAEILDAAFRLVQTEWRTLLGLSLLMQIPWIGLGAFAGQLFDPFAGATAGAIEPGTEWASRALLEGSGVVAGLGLLYLILYPFIAAAVTASVARFYLGRRFELVDAARAGLHSLVPLVASYLVYLVACLGAMLIAGGAVGMLVVVGAALLGDAIEMWGAAGVWLAFLLGLVAFAFFTFGLLFMGALSSLLPPVAVLESAGVVGTVRRAFTLASGARIRVVVVIMTAGLIVGIPVMGAQVWMGFMPVLGLLAWAVLQALGFAFTSSVAVVLYLDLRCRAESYDLELLAQQVEAGASLAD